MEALNTAGLIPQLSDLELAILVSLVAQEHCLIETSRDCVDDVSKELALVASNTFGLSYVLLDCSPAMSLDDFSNGVLESGHSVMGSHHPSPRMQCYTEIPRKPSSFHPIQGRQEYPILLSNEDHFDDRKVVNVVIAKNFHKASGVIQIQVLELLRSGRMFIKTAIHTTPRTFLFIPLIAYDKRDFQRLPLNKHLNDHLFISHYHKPRDSCSNLSGDDISDDQASISSVIRKTGAPQTGDAPRRRISEEAITDLRLASNSIAVRAEIARYLQNIVVFLRLHRAVAGGISARASSHFFRLATCLASLHGLDYITPSIVALAARKIYYHRIVVSNANDDRSLQYGSNPAMVSSLLMNVNPDMIINHIIREIEAPL